MNDQSRALLEKLLRRLSVESLGALEGPTYDGIVQGLVQLTNASTFWSRKGSPRKHSSRIPSWRESGIAE